MKPQKLHRDIGAVTGGRSMLDGLVLCTHEHQLQNDVDALRATSCDIKQAVHVVDAYDPGRAHKLLAWHRDHRVARLQDAEIKTNINT